MHNVPREIRIRHTQRKIDRDMQILSEIYTLPDRFADYEGAVMFCQRFYASREGFTKGNLRAETNKIFMALM